MKIRVKATEKGTRRTAPWVAAGTLAAYTVLGGRMAAPARAGEVSLDSESGPALQGQQPVLRFDIPAGSLETVLGAFQTVSGVTVTLPAGSIKGLASPASRATTRPSRRCGGCSRGPASPTASPRPDAAVLELRLRETVDVTAVAQPVSSPKYTEPLRDIPQTITVVPRAVIEEQDATTLRDVLRNVHRHQHPGRRRRRARGRQPVHPRLQRPHRHLHRRRARLRRLLPRPLQRGAGGGGEGPGVVVRRPRLHRRLGEPGRARLPDGGGVAHGSSASGTDAYKRGTVDLNQPISGARSRARPSG